MNRAPDLNGLAYWIGQLQTRLTDEQLEAVFLAAPEYVADHGGNAENWVIGMYHDLLGRAPDNAGLAYWTNQIASGESEYSIALGFAASSEREGDVVTKDYQTYLGRSPAPDEVSYWVDQFVNHGQRNEDVIAGFIGSSEYYNDPNQGAGNATTWLDSVFNELYQRQPTGTELSSWLSALGQTPDKLTAPSITVGAVSTTQATLSWNSVSGATGYVIDQLINGTPQELGQCGSDSTSQTITSLSPGSTYTFEVGASDSTGTVWSNPVSVTTSSPQPQVTWQEPAAGVAYAPASGALFGAGGPVYSDVHQGAEGDCWLMASLAEVAARDPQDIRNMFTDKGAYQDNGATVEVYSVRFYNSAGAAESVNVDTELPDSGEYYDRVQNGVLWVALAEKAYAEANGMGYVTTQETGIDSYDALNGGDPGWGLQAITGRPANDYYADPSDVANAWNAGQLIVLGSSSGANDNYGIVGDSSGTHAYAVVGYNPSNNLPFELYNPWGVPGEVLFNGHQVWGGVFDANAAAIANLFASESFGTGAQPTEAAEQPVAVATASHAIPADAGNLASDVAAATPASSAHAAAFADTSWLDDMDH